MRNFPFSGHGKTKPKQSQFWPTCPLRGTASNHDMHPEGCGFAFMGAEKRPSEKARPIGY